LSGHAAAVEAIDRILDRGGDADEVLRAVVQTLLDGFEHYSWVGIYFVEEGELALGPWQGPAPAEQACIPIGRGLCGGVASSGRTEVVDEIGPDPGQVSSAGSTRAQIAVPIRWQGAVIGVIDVESDSPAAFSAEDRAFLEQVAVRISAHCLVGWDTGGVPWDEVS